MKPVILVFSALMLFNASEAQKHAMMNHTDVRIPPARPVRPLMANNMDTRETPVLRIEKESDASPEYSLEEYKLGDKIFGDGHADAKINSKGAYKIFKASHAVEVAYSFNKDVRVQTGPEKASPILAKTVKDHYEMEMDRKSFVRGSEERDHPLSIFSGSENDDIGYQLVVPDDLVVGGEWNAGAEIDGRVYSNNYRVISRDEDHVVVKINYQVSGAGETRHSEGLIAVDRASGMITEKDIRITTSGNMKVKGVVYDFQGTGELHMQLE